MGEVEESIGGDGERKKKKIIYEYKHKEIINNFEKGSEEIRKRKWDKKYSALMFQVPKPSMERKRL